MDNIIQIEQQIFNNSSLTYGTKALGPQAKMKKKHLQFQPCQLLINRHDSRPNNRACQQNQSPLSYDQINLIKQTYLHPIFFPQEVSQPQKVIQVYRNLYRIANSPSQQFCRQVNNLNYQTTLMDYQPMNMNISNFSCKQSPNRINNCYSQDALSQINQWILHFIQSFISIRIPRIKCSRLLKYWQWILSSYAFEDQLQLIKRQKSQEFTSKKLFDWNQCKKFFNDKAFCLQIVQWTFAFRDKVNAQDKRRGEKFGNFIKILFRNINQVRDMQKDTCIGEIDQFNQNQENIIMDEEKEQQIIDDQNRNQIIDSKKQQAELDRPNEFINFQHSNCQQCSKYWDQKNMKDQFPTLSHLYYAIRYKFELECIEKEVQRHSNFYNKKLKSIYELQIQKKYKNTLFPDQRIEDDDKEEDRPNDKCLIKSNNYNILKQQNPQCQRYTIEGIDFIKAQFFLLYR